RVGCAAQRQRRDLLTRYGVRVDDADLRLLHQRSEGWAAALQMAALSLRGAADPARAARVLDVRNHDSRRLAWPATCSYGVTWPTAATISTCSSAPGRRSRPARNWPPGWPRCAASSMG